MVEKLIGKIVIRHWVLESQVSDLGLCPLTSGCWAVSAHQRIFGILNFYINLMIIFLSDGYLGAPWLGDQV